MPNTLAHAGLQGFATRIAAHKADLKWAYLGCVIPDVPWILQRAAHALALGLDPYLLRSYVIIQASLLGCLILSAAGALLARAFWWTWGLLSGNAALHLVLDAMQTKWGNGVHFWAPLSWDLTNWGLFWPESVPTYALTAFGLLYVVLYWQPSVANPLGETWPGVSRSAGILVLLASYFLGPLLMLEKPVEADAHSLKTLSKTEERRGRPVEMDRARYVRNQGGHFLEYYGEQVPVEDLGISPPATVSIQGTFVTKKRVRATRLHVHAGGLRDYPSYLGLVLIAAVWGVSAMKRHRKQQ